MLIKFSIEKKLFGAIREQPQTVLSCANKEGTAVRSQNSRTAIFEEELF